MEELLIIREIEAKIFVTGSRGLRVYWICQSLWAPPTNFFAYYKTKPNLNREPRRASCFNIAREGRNASAMGQQALITRQIDLKVFVTGSRRVPDSLYLPEAMGAIQCGTRRPDCFAALVQGF